MSAPALESGRSAQPSSERLDEIGRALSEARLGNGSRRHLLGVDGAMRHDAERAAREALPALQQVASEMRHRAQVMAATSSLLPDTDRDAHAAAAVHAAHLHQAVDNVIKDLGSTELRMRATAASKERNASVGSAFADAVRDAGTRLQRVARESQAVERAEQLANASAQRPDLASRRANPGTVLSQLVDKLNERERNEGLRKSLGEMHLHAIGRVHEAAADASRAREGIERASATSHAFDRSLAAVYRDPTSARRAFVAEAETRGLDAAVRAMRDRPEVFGSLATVERKYIGFVRFDDSRPAKAAARETAERARVALVTAKGAPTRESVKEANARILAAKGHEEKVRGAATRMRTTDVDREIGRLADHLSPEEWRRFKVIATEPQFALVRHYHAQVRDAMMGREINQ